MDEELITNISDSIFNYIENKLNHDKTKTIIEFGSGGGELAIMLQSSGYDIIATDVVEDFLSEQNRIGIKKVVKYN